MTTRDMNNNEALEMLNRCKHEIMQMRETINQLKPKAEAYDNLVIVLNLLPRVSQGFGEDLVWTIQKRIDELTPKPEANPAPEPGPANLQEANENPRAKLSKQQLREMGKHKNTEDTE